jgi:dephospho-CoA kinase
MPRPSRKRIGRPRPQPRPAGPWKYGPIPVIGLIGGIGAGKSRVAALLAEAGAAVIDADVVGHALLDQRPVRELVTARFGPQVLAPREPAAEPETEAGTGTDAEAEANSEANADAVRVDRRVLGAIVFSDPAALRQLESILHPRMRRTFERAIARTVRRGQARAVVLDAAILLEAGWDTLCDRVVFVEASADRRLARLAAARGWTAETLAKREAAQWPLERKFSRADRVIVNDHDHDQDQELDSGPGSLHEQVRRLTAALFASPRPGRVPAGPGRSRSADASRRP